jgi:ribonuclease HI
LELGLKVFTDGACRVSTNDGGIGIVFVKGDEIIYTFNKHFSNVTNNQMEIMAVVYALHAISTTISSITIISDSQYVLGCINKGWARKKNQKYWKLFDKVYQKAKNLCSEINFEWTKGHNVDKYNNEADRLAVDASHFLD